jgi:exonuclease III
MVLCIITWSNGIQAFLFKGSLKFKLSRNIWCPEFTRDMACLQQTRWTDSEAVRSYMERFGFGSPVVEYFRFSSWE